MPAAASQDPYDILLGYNRWGNTRVMELCGPLTREPYYPPFPLGPAERGGWQAAPTRIFSAMLQWADRVARRRARRSPRAARPGFTLPTDDREGTLPAFAGHVDDVHATLAQYHPAVAADPGTVMPVQFAARSHQFTVAAADVLALTRVRDHRAQCLNLLSPLGFTRLPESDVVDWQHRAECLA